MAYRAPLNVEIYGSIEKGDELYHEVNFYEGSTYMIRLEAADDNVDLDLYIADDEGTVFYKDEDRESGATAKFEVVHSCVSTLVVKAVDGDTDYTISIEEQ